MHNDYLTECKNTADYETCLPSDVFVTAAIWTTEYCHSVKDIEKYAALRHHSESCLSIEDCGCIAPQDFWIFDHLGIASATLTWNYANRYAGGAYSDADLTEEGVALCEYLDHRNIYIDCAHLNDRSFYQVFDLGVKIFDSHTAVAECRAHPRASRLERMRKIAERGGLVGITLVRDFIGDGIDDWVRQIDTVCSVLGHKVLGLGTDFWGSIGYIASEFNHDYKMLADLVEKLRNMGYNETVVQDIFADNYLNLRSHCHA